MFTNPSLLHECRTCTGSMVGESCLVMANVKTPMESQTLIQWPEDFGSMLLNLRQLQLQGDFFRTAEAN